MADLKQVAEVLQPAARANSAVVTIVQELAAKAADVQDPEAKRAMLHAADELLKASSTITEALVKVSVIR